MSPHAPLIIDVAGLSLSKADRRRLKNPLTGGMILFGRNWENRRSFVIYAPRSKAFARTC